MTRQSIFNTVANHLITQSARSLDSKHSMSGSPFCTYRGKDGLRCAIGSLIDDAHYHPSLEGLMITTKEVQDAIEGMDAFIAETFRSDQTSYENENTQFLNQLQIIHDCRPVALWGMELVRFARRYELNLEDVPALKGVI